MNVLKRANDQITLNAAKQQKADELWDKQRNGGAPDTLFLQLSKFVSTLARSNEVFLNANETFTVLEKALENYRFGSRLGENGSDYVQKEKSMFFNKDFSERRYGIISTGEASSKLRILFDDVHRHLSKHYNISTRKLEAYFDNYLSIDTIKLKDNYSAVSTKKVFNGTPEDLKANAEKFQSALSEVVATKLAQQANQR